MAAIGRRGFQDMVDGVGHRPAILPPDPARAKTFPDDWEETTQVFEGADAEPTTHVRRREAAGAVRAAYLNAEGRSEAEVWKSIANAWREVYAAERAANLELKAVIQFLADLIWRR